MCGYSFLGAGAGHRSGRGRRGEGEEEGPGRQGDRREEAREEAGEERGRQRLKERRDQAVNIRFLKLNFNYTLFHF